ncbi:cytochrome bd oxidase small subunit CydS [Marinicrinis sediminis]|uniref:Cbb3-type cytochrome oxidase assembly protein CcoS n=1 Tax=Marinicrinis sediminis TaxID=1652465 RepID=A0ABW5R9E6_9BACL
MQEFLIFYLPFILVAICVAGLFIWGAKGHTDISE